MKDNEAFFIVSIFLVILMLSGLAYALGKNAIAEDCKSLQKFHFNGQVYDCIPRNTSPTALKPNLKRMM